MQTDLSIYNSLRPSFIEGVHAVKFNALSAVISRYRDYTRSSEQIKAYSGDSLLMRDIASLLDEAPRPITREYQDFTPFLLLLMLSEEFHVVHYVERLVTWYFGYCCVDELRTVCTILSECSYPHHDTLRLRFKNYLREARKTLGMPVECNAAVMLKMLDASYEHLTPADVGEFEELLHLGDDYEFISRVKSNYLASDNVTELAGVCGYSSTITFRRRFQRVFGCSASSWLRILFCVKSGVQRAFAERNFGLPQRRLRGGLCGRQIFQVRAVRPFRRAGCRSERRSGAAGRCGA